MNCRNKEGLRLVEEIGFKRTVPRERGERGKEREKEREKEESIEVQNLILGAKKYST